MEKNGYKMDKIIVIQCSNKKHDDAGTFGRGHIKFVANPEDDLEFRPDDIIPKASMTWREYLTLYNLKGKNKDSLSHAGKLYKNKTYAKLIDRYGEKNVYILSAGWGLIRSDYLIPKYDITFSASAKKKNRRKQADPYSDYNQLLHIDLHDKEVHFFGGKDYLELFCRLTAQLRGDKYIHYATDNIEKQRGYNYIKYPRCFTNWHYQAVKDFLASH